MNFGNMERVIRTVSNLSIYAERKALEDAEINMYLLTQHRHCIKYTGSDYEIQRNDENYIKYLVNGIKVVGFEKDLDIREGYIVPVWERGYVLYYLYKSV